MGGLGRRLDRLEQRRPRRDVCPEHRVGIGPGTDWRQRFRDALRAFSPDDDERAAYHAEEDRLAALPPCPRCGWKEAPPFWIAARAVEDWGPR